MENILIANVVKDTALLLTVETAIADLAAKEILAIGDGNVILGSANVAADFVGIKEVMFVVGLGGGRFKTSVSIPRRCITSYNFQTTTAALPKIIRIGGTTAPLALVIPSTGEANILLKNLSYNHGIATQRLSYSTMKKASETAEAFVDRVVLEINTAMALQTSTFATAAKVVSGAFLGITFTASDSSVDLFVGRDGIFADSSYAVTQEPKVAIGAGADILAMEIDMQRHHGNSGYETNGSLWYKEPPMASASLLYHVTTLYWDGNAETPTTSFKAATNVLQFAADTTDSDDSIQGFVALIAGAQDDAILDTDPDAIDGTVD